MGEIREVDLKVKSITEVDSATEKEEKVIHKLVAESKLGNEKVTYVRSDPFTGMKPGVTIITMNFVNDQKTLKEFNEVED